MSMSTPDLPSKAPSMTPPVDQIIEEAHTDGTELEEEEEEDDTGATVLPVSKLKKILKIDPNYTVTSELAVFVIAKLTELFIKHLAMKAHLNATTEKRKTVQYKDFSLAVALNEDLKFLKRMVPQTTSVRKLVAKDAIKYSKTASALKSTAKSKPKAPEKGKIGLEKGQQTLNFKKLKTNSEKAVERAESVDSEGMEQDSDKGEADGEKTESERGESVRPEENVEDLELVDSEPDYSDNDDEDDDIKLEEPEEKDAEEDDDEIAEIEK